MGTLFTAIGKILNIKFLLIFLSIIFYIDLYFHLKYQISFIENYQNYLNLKEILLIIISYLITLNIVIPLLAFMLSWIGFIIRLFLSTEKIEKVMDFISDNSLNNLSMLELKAIKENNSALMKSYELKLEKYHEIHTIYLFSFFILNELIFLQKYDSFSSQIISKAVELLYFAGDKGEEIFSFVFLGVPFLILVLFSCRYISSFKTRKIYNWIGNIE